MELPRLFFTSRMNIEYSENIDKEIHEEVNNNGERLSLVFGFDRPIVSFKKIDAAVSAARFVGPASAYINVKKAGEAMKKLYGRAMPQVDIFINTTPFSTWNTEQGYISISIQRFPEKVFSSFCHEMNHFMYDISYGTEKYEDTEVKETLTVLNEHFGIKDYGWKVFEPQRKIALDYYKRSGDLKQTIQRVQASFLMVKEQ